MAEHNPFASMELRYPEGQREYYNQYAGREERRSSIDQSPFPRMVDFWFLGLCLAARKKSKPKDLSGTKTSKIIEGYILDRDSWRIQMIMLTAIAIEDENIVGNPREMMKIANGLAAVGIPSLVGMLDNGKDYPIYNLSDSLKNMLEEEATSG